MREHSYTDVFELNRWTGTTLPRSIRETLKIVPPSRGPLHGYNRSIDIILAATIASNASQAVMPYENIWRMLDRVGYRTDQHSFLQNMPGCLLALSNMMDGFNIRGDNNGEVWTADISNVPDTTDIYMKWSIPMETRAFTHEAKHQADGSFPLSLCGDKAELTLDFTDTHFTEEYAVTAYAVKVRLQNRWTEDILVPRPWIARHIQTSENPAEMHVSQGKWDQAWCILATYGDWPVLDTYRPRVVLDGLTIQDTVSAQQLLYSKDTHRDTSLTTFWPNGLLPFVTPTEVESILNLPVGAKMIIYDASGSGETLLFFTRKYVPIGPEFMSVFQSAMGLRGFDASKDPERLQVGSRPITSYRWNRARRVVGMPVKVKV